MIDSDKQGFRKLLTAAYKIYDKRVADSDLNPRMNIKKPRQNSTIKHSIMSE